MIHNNGTAIVQMLFISILERKNILEDVEPASNDKALTSLGSGTLVGSLQHDRSRNSIFMGPEGEDNWIWGSCLNDNHKSPYENQLEQMEMHTGPCSLACAVDSIACF